MATTRNRTRRSDTVAADPKHYAISGTDTLIDPTTSGKVDNTQIVSEETFKAARRDPDGVKTHGVAEHPAEGMLMNHVLERITDPADYQPGDQILSVTPELVVVRNNHITRPANSSDALIVTPV